ncbi:MAG: hypothetical protein A2X84_02895 [Desulfuromonadaceae bacterium GWC2_58_13]|nr:MAG: hypothetical protein A2X84_02895 [Desulfuromonadaceae bacterium GWC2_58_13]
MKIPHRASTLLLFFFGLMTNLALAAEDPIPTRFSLAASFGKTYSPNNDIDFVLATGAALFDYDRVWPHRAPESLRFKVEGSIGMTTAPRHRALVSVNMLALYFVDGLETHLLRPYVEAGIGLIYTDFQVDGQGLRLNFNPQAGLGMEIKSEDGPPWYAAIRLHHISNGELHDDNDGINAAVLQVGRFF